VRNRFGGEFFASAKKAKTKGEILAFRHNYAVKTNFPLLSYAPHNQVHFLKGASRVICETSSARRRLRYPVVGAKHSANAAPVPRSFTRMLRPCWRVSSPLAEGEAFVNELRFVISPSRMLRPYPWLPPLFRNAPAQSGALILLKQQGVARLRARSFANLR